MNPSEVSSSDAIITKQSFCERCNKYINVKNFSRHVMDMHTVGRYKCDECSREFGSSAYLERHMIDHHPIKMQKSTQTFLSYDDVSSHCSPCFVTKTPHGYAFPHDASLLNEHIEKEHINTLPMQMRDVKPYTPFQVKIFINKLSVYSDTNSKTFTQFPPKKKKK